MAAYKTLKLVSADYQALKMLLRLLAGKVSIDFFRAFLVAQGRRVENIPDDELVAAIAGLLINAVD